jgi:hypothetical protein
MPKVYFPQVPVRRTAGACGPVFIPLYDTSAAEQYGELVTVLPNGISVSNSPVILDLVREKFATFSDEDFIVAIGDPAAIAMCVMCASMVNGGRINLLRWTRWTTSYQNLKLEVSSHG